MTLLTATHGVVTPITSKSRLRIWFPLPFLPDFTRFLLQWAMSDPFAATHVSGQLLSQPCFVSLLLLLHARKLAHATKPTLEGRPRPCSTTYCDANPTLSITPSAVGSIHSVGQVARNSAKSALISSTGGRPTSPKLARVRPNVARIAQIWADRFPAAMGGSNHPTGGSADPIGASPDDMGGSAEPMRGAANAADGPADAQAASPPNRRLRQAIPPTGPAGGSAEGRTVMLSFCNLRRHLHIRGGSPRRLQIGRTRGLPRASTKEEGPKR